MPLKESREIVHQMLLTTKLNSDAEWNKVEFKVKQWLDEFKKWEMAETFERAFKPTFRRRGTELSSSCPGW